MPCEGNRVEGRVTATFFGMPKREMSYDHESEFRTFEQAKQAIS